MFAALCLVIALVLTIVSLACASAAVMQHPHSWREIPSAVIMSLSTLVMVVPMLAPAISFGAVDSPIAWAGLTLGAALLSLLNKSNRTEAAMTAGSFLIMALMWAAMGATPPESARLLERHVHAGATVAQFALILGVLSVLMAATLTAVALHRCWNQRTGASGIRISTRIATLHHPTMSLGMLLMGLGMTAPALLS